MTTRKATKSSRKRSVAKRAVTPMPGKQSEVKRNADGLKIRMYRVGFGDFFLVTVPTDAGDKYILIDCGVFKGTSGSGDIGSIVEAVEDMYQTTGGELALVIMTHRHADHIAGFSKAERFQDFKAGMVWMPYWEQFNDGPGGAKDAGSSDEQNFAFNLQTDIGALAENLGMLFRGREDEAGKEALAQLANATGIDDFSAAANGKKKEGSNAKALEILKNHLGQNGKNVKYYAAGDEPELPAELVGLTARILGPPPQQASAFMSLTDLKKGIGQYLDSMSDSEIKPKAFQPFSYEWNAALKRDYPRIDRQKRDINYREMKERIDASQPDMFAAAAAKIETFLNNQSLVVLFEFGGKKLLFAGDAQAGNWEYWLYRTKEPVRDPTKAGDMVTSSKELLQSIDFYKVGHHGSTNATPIQAIETAVDRPKSNQGFVSMCSTQDGVYGNPDKDTEVPRRRLMDVLKDGSTLVRSDSIDITLSTGENKPRADGAAGNLPKAKVGKLSRKNLYIEYSF